MMQLKPWQSILQEKHKWNLKHYTIPLISKGNLQNIQVFQTHNETPQVLYILHSKLKPRNQETRFFCKKTKRMNHGLGLALG